MHAAGRRTWIWAAAVFVTAALVFLWRAQAFVFPPGNDTTYYLLGAQSLALGRGLQEDVVWHYLRPPAALPQPANDYWMPLTSLLVAPSLAICGDTYHAALLPIVILAAITAVQCFLFCSLALDSRLLGALCAAAYILDPRVQTYGTCTDTAIPYAGAAVGMMWCYHRAVAAESRRSAWLLALGALAGCAALTRGDALVVMPLTALACVAVSRRVGARTLPLGSLVLAATGLAMVLLPWMVRNLIAFGSAWNPAAARAALLTEYADLYAYGKEIDAGAFLQHLGAHPLRVLNSKVMMFVTVCEDFARLLPLYALPLVLWGTVGLVRARSPIVILAGCFPLVLAGAYAALADIVEGAYHSMLTAMPLALAGAAWSLRQGLEALLHRLASPAQRRDARLRHAAVAVLVAAVLLAPRLPSLHGVVDASGARQQASYAPIRAWLDAHAAGPRDGVMSAQPWQARYCTGRPAVMLPSTGPAAAREVAKKYGVTTLLLDGYYIETPGYETFLHLYRDGVADPRFVLRFEVERWKLFQIVDHEPGP